MGITDYAKSRTALLIGGSTVNVPTYFVIGSGSGTFASSQTTLIAEEDRQAVTSTDLTSTYKVIYQGDWNAVEMSGLTLNEFGLIGSASASTGSIWSRTNLPSITFDGTNELRIQETVEIY